MTGLTNQPKTVVINYNSLGALGFTKCGYVAPADITYVEWTEAGEIIKQIDRFKNFAIGDWILTGEQKFGEMYAQAMDDYEWGTYDKLTKLVWVARNVPHVNRRVELTWTHHHHVAKLLYQEQSQWLQKAIDNRLSSDELRDTIREQWEGERIVVVPPLPTPVAVADITYRATNTKDALTMQECLEVVARHRWPLTTGTDNLPPVMRPFEHEALATYSNVLADMAGWIPGDHGLKVHAQADHLAKLYKWNIDKQKAYLTEQLAEIAKLSRMSEAELYGHIETAQRFAQQNRMQTATVGYQHHYLLRAMTPANADYWLDLANSRGWTAQELAEQLHVAYEPQIEDTATAKLWLSTGAEIIFAPHMIKLDCMRGTIIIEGDFKWRIE